MVKSWLPASRVGPALCGSWTLRTLKEHGQFAREHSAGRPCRGAKTHCTSLYSGCLGRGAVRRDRFRLRRYSGHLRCAVRHDRDLWRRAGGNHGGTASRANPDGRVYCRPHQTIALTRFPYKSTTTRPRMRPETISEATRGTSASFTWVVMAASLALSRSRASRRHASMRLGFGQ